jgi:aromatic ring hydroxylase
VRTGAEYRERLRDGRRVWVMGDGWIGDVTVHPATAGMVAEYAAWYDRHFDPAWSADLLLPLESAGAATPVCFTIPMIAEDLQRLGRAVYRQAFATGGHVTHTPAYGALIEPSVNRAAHRSPQRRPTVRGWRKRASSSR